LYPNLFRFPEWVPFLGGEYVTSFGVMMFFAFLVLGYLYPVAAPEGWFGQRVEEKVRDR